PLTRHESYSPSLPGVLAKSARTPGYRLWPLSRHSSWDCGSRVRLPFPLPVSGVAEARQDVFVRQVRIIRNDLFLGHPRGQVRQNVVNRDAQRSDARLTAPLVRLDGND